MKRQKFRLGNVLRFYELQKQRAELDLHQASKLLRDAEVEIARLSDEIGVVAALIQAGQKMSLSIAAWLACYRKSEFLGAQRARAQEERGRHALAVMKHEEARKKWAIAEETLRSLQHGVDAFNHEQAAKDQQEILDEAVLRKWLEHGQENHADSPKE